MREQNSEKPQLFGSNGFAPDQRPVTLVLTASSQASLISTCMTSLWSDRLESYKVGVASGIHGA